MIVVRHTYTPVTQTLLFRLSGLNIWNGVLVYVSGILFTHEVPVKLRPEPTACKPFGCQALAVSLAVWRVERTDQWMVGVVGRCHHTYPLKALNATNSDIKTCDCRERCSTFSFAHYMLDVLFDILQTPIVSDDHLGLSRWYGACSNLFRDENCRSVVSLLSCPPISRSSSLGGWIQID